MSASGTPVRATETGRHGIRTTGDPVGHRHGRPPADQAARGTPHQPCAGSGRLLRLALREDRLRIGLWTAGLTAMALVTVPAVETAYGGSEGMQARAEVAGNAATVLINGPTFATPGTTGTITLGSVVASELGMMTFLAVAVMSILLVTRHTRAEEDSGRADLVGSLANGRLAPAVAALGVTAVADGAVALGLFAALQGHGLPEVDLVAFCVSVMAAGLVFGALAALTAQVADHARAATGLALTLLGATYVLRGIGDVRDPVDGTVLSWVSPLAWLQQVRPWVGLRWWPLALTLAAAAVLVGIAAVLGARRDLGAGLVPSRPGRRQGPRWLASPAGLAWHELTGDVVAWAAGLGAFAVLFGAMTSTMVDAMGDIPTIREWMALDPDAVTETLLAAMASYFTLGTAAFAVTAALHLRHEERAGTAAVAVASGPGRARWMLSWLLVVCGATLLVQLAGGVGLGVGVALDGGDWSAPLDLAGDALVTWPAVLVFVGLVVALFGVAPRWAGLAWAAVSWALFASIFGSLLDLPGWATNLSPVEVAPRVPYEQVTAAPLFALSALAVALCAAGLAGFRRRDLG
jgi:ABC-2 type transport system permease protein